MTKTIVSLKRSAALAGALLLAPAALLAQAPAELPAAAELVAKHVAAIGGRDAVMKQSFVRRTGAMITWQGDSVPFTLAIAHPNRHRLAMRFPDGEGLSGYDGTNGWAYNPVHGPEIETGTALDYTRSVYDVAIRLREPQAFKSIRTVELTSLNDEPCYKVELVWLYDRTSYDCYSVASGLSVGEIEMIDSHDGPKESITLFLEYKEFGGVKYPALATRTVDGFTTTFTLDGVETGPLDEAAVAAPAEVKRLLGSR